MTDFAPNSWEAVVFEKFCRQEKIEFPRRSAAKSSKVAQDLFSDRFWKVQSGNDDWFNQPKFVAAFDAFMNKFYPASGFKFELQRTMETLLVFIIEMSRARDKADRALACINLLQKHTQKALLTAERFTECVEKGSTLMNYIMDFYSMLFDKPDGPEVQSADETFAFLHSILDSYDSVKEHPFVVKFQRFGMYALSLSLFTKLGLTFKNCGYSKVEEKFLKQKYTLGVSFLHCLLDTFLFVTEKGYQCIQTGTWDPIIHCGNEYSKWFAEVTKLRVQALYMSDPEALKELKARDASVEVISQFEFLSKADELIEQGQAILKFAPKMKDVERSTLSVAMGQLQLLRANEVTKRAAQKMRQAPFSLLVSGGSSVGKSTLVDLIYYQIAKTLKLPSGSEYKYTRNFADGFWSGFHPGMWFLILDDVAFLHPNKAPNGDPSLLEVIQIVNRIPLVTNQAELADKGKCPCRAKCVVATTNSPDLNATKYFSCPLAIQRRFPFMIDVSPRAQFLKDGQFMDSSKVQEWKEHRAPTEVFDDLWAIKLYKIQPEVRMQNGVDPRVGQKGKHVRINDKGTPDDEFEFETIYDFLAWVSRTMLAHQQNEDMMDNAGSEARDVSICGSCFHPIVRCKCIVPAAQAGDEDEVVDIDAILRETEVDEEDEVPVVDAEIPAPSVEQLARDFPDQVVNDTGMEWRARPNPIREELSAEGAWFKACHKARTYFRNTVVDVETMADEFMYPFRNRPMGWRSIQADDEYTRWERVKMAMMYPFFAAFMHCATVRYCTLWLIFTFRGDRLAKRCLQYTGFLRLFTRNIVWQTGERMARQFAGTEAVRECAKQILGMSGSIIAITVLVTYGLKIMGWLTGETKSKKQKKAAKSAVQSAKAQGAVESVGQAPVALPNERVNAWQQSDYQTTSFDVSPQTTSRARDDFQSFVNMIGKNCLSLRSSNYGVLGGIRRGKATCVTGHIYLTNNHVLPTADTFDLELVSEQFVNPMTKNVTIRMNQAQIHRYPELDLALFEVLALPPRKDIRALFMQESLFGSANGTLLSLELDGTFTKRQFMSAARTECNVEKIEATKFWVSLIDKPTELGDCGSVSIANTRKGPVILGIHVAGEGKTVMSLPVSAQWLTSEVAKFTKFPIQSGSPMLAAPSAQRHLCPQVHGLSVVNWMREGKIAGVYGSFLGFRNNKTSSVKPTVIAEACAKRGYETKFGAPDMSRVPWYNALHDLVDPVLKLDADLLRKCADAYAADIMKAIPDEIKKTIHVLDMESTINGAPGVAYIDAMKRNTSAGCPWKKSKKYFFKPAAPRGNIQDPVDVDPEIMDRVEEMRSRYKQGKRCMPVFNGCAKDEPLKFKKVEAKKTRIFTGSPVDFSILMRQYLLCTARLIQNNRFVCESAPGTNAHSKEWEEIRTYLVQHGKDRMIAGDYAAFDKRMSPVVILMAFRVLISLCIFSGNYSDEDILVLHGIAEDIAFPLIDFNGDLLEILGSNPSGHVLTVIINCIANCIYMRYVFAKLAKKNGASTDDEIMLRFFKKLVALITYGDDNAMGVSKRCPWFNHTAIQQELALVGITYTMADKEAESVPYIDIDEVSFLKRYWRWDEDLEAYVCPLEEGSIEKTLMVCVASDTITPEQQAVESLQACCTEYFWFGRKVFEEKRQMMIEVARESGLEDLLAARPLPTWQKLADRYHGKENADEPTLVGKILRGLLQ